MKTKVLILNKKIKNNWILENPLKNKLKIKVEAKLKNIEV